MKNRPPFVLKWPLFFHNVFLCIISIILTLGIVYEVFRSWYYKGLRSVYCGTGDDDWDLELLKWGIYFYLSKFYELFDTVFLALRKKHLSVLHLFHHILVATACWIQIRNEMYFGWITGFNNALIHVFMYYYFAVQSVSARDIWWKKYLTQAQILQFVIDCTTSLPWLYFYLNGVPCRGDLRAWFVANTGGILLIILFVNFYIHSYNANKKSSTQHETTEKRHLNSKKSN